MYGVIEVRKLGYVLLWGTTTIPWAQRKVDLANLASMFYVDIVSRRGRFISSNIMTLERVYLARSLLMK